jgi:hypothetical protein
VVYGHRRGLERPGLRDPMGPMGLMRPPISLMSPIEPVAPYLGGGRIPSVHSAQRVPICHTRPYADAFS